MDTYQLTVHAPARLVGRPRLWRLAGGLASLGLALELLLPQAAPSYWNAAVLGDARLAGWALLLLGGFHAVRALRTDLLELHRVSFGRAALHLDWSHVPGLGEPRRARQSSLAWGELQGCEWVEGEAEHDLKQYLLVRFRQPLGRHTEELKILLSHGRDRQHCQNLLAYLPETLLRPGWLQAEAQGGRGV